MLIQIEDVVKNSLFVIIEVIMMAHTDWNKLTLPAEIPYKIRERRKTYEEKVTWRVALEQEENEGWYFFKDTKNPDKVKVHKDKSVHEQFENRVWVLFATMGFSLMNRDNSFSINYSDNGRDLNKQIDVFAGDDETVLVIECKCAENPNSNKQFKTELEAIKGYMTPVKNEIRKQFPGRNIRACF